MTTTNQIKKPNWFRGITFGNTLTIITILTTVLYSSNQINSRIDETNGRIDLVLIESTKETRSLREELVGNQETLQASIQNYQNDLNEAAEEHSYLKGVVEGLVEKVNSQ